MLKYILHDITARKNAENELIKAKERAEQSEEKLIEAQALSHVGGWEYIIDTDTITWSKELFNIFERCYDLPAPQYSEQQQHYTEESFAILDKAVLDCVQRGIPYEIELEIITTSGTIKQIISKGRGIKDKNNKIIGCYGTAQEYAIRKDTT
jgi:PAS domain-containing protein